MALVYGLALLHPVQRLSSFRLEGNGLFSKRLELHNSLGKKRPPPGLHQLQLWPRTDQQGFVVKARLVEYSLKGQAEPGQTPIEPLRFHLRGLWLGALHGVGRVLVVPQEPLETPPFVVYFLQQKPEPSLGYRMGVQVAGFLERGRLIGVAEPTPASAFGEPEPSAG